LYRLIQLTDKFDFDFSQLKRFIAQNSNIKIISIFLQQTRSVKYYFIFIDISISFVTQICNILRDIISEKIFKIIDIEFTSNEESATKYRYEKFYKNSYLSIKSWFFLSDIYKINSSKILHFIVNCNIFYIFFDFSISVDLNNAQSKSVVLDISSKTFDFLFYFFLRVIKFIKRSAKRQRSAIRNNKNNSANILLKVTNEIAFDKSINIDILEEANAENQSITNRNSNKIQINNSSQNNTYYNENNEVDKFLSSQVRKSFSLLQICKSFLLSQIRKSFSSSLVRKFFLSPQVRKFSLSLLVCKSFSSQKISQLNSSNISKRSNLSTDSVSAVVYKNLVAEYKTNFAYSNLFFVDIEKTTYQIFYSKFSNIKNIWIYFNNYVSSCVIAQFNLDLNKWKTLISEIISDITIKKSRDKIVVVFRTRNKNNKIELVLIFETIFSKFEQSSIAERLQAIEDR